MSTNVVSMATHGIDLYSTNYKVEEHEVWSCRSESDCQAQYETLYDLVSHMRNVHPACTITCQVNGCEQLALPAYGIGMFAGIILPCILREREEAIHLLSRQWNVLRKMMINLSLVCQASLILILINS